MGNLLVNAGPMGMGVMARYSPINNRAYLARSRRHGEVSPMH